MQRGEEKRPFVRPGWVVYLDRKRIARSYGTKNWEEVHFPEIKWLVSEHLVDSLHDEHSAGCGNRGTTPLSLAMRARRTGLFAEFWKAWRAELAVSPQSIRARPTFVAMVGIEVAGFYSLSPLGRSWELDNLWVLPRFMRLGVGRALLSHALETAARGGARKSPLTPTRMPSRSILNAGRFVAARFLRRFRATGACSSTTGVQCDDSVMRVAFGLKARTGRAALVAVAGDVHEPQLIERSQIQLLPDGAFAPYHAAKGWLRRRRERASG